MKSIRMLMVGAMSLGAATFAADVPPAAPAAAAPAAAAPAAAAPGAAPAAAAPGADGAAGARAGRRGGGAGGARAGGAGGAGGRGRGPSIAPQVNQGFNAEWEAPHFHHFHVNSTNVDNSLRYYKQVFGGLPVNFRNETGARASFFEQSYAFFNPVTEAPRGLEETSLWHVGWAGVDGPNEAAYWTAQGIQFQTPVTPLAGNFYMYMYGPDKELIEIYTGDRNHRFNHVHRVVDDISKSLVWYRDNLNFPITNTNIPMPEAGTIPQSAGRSSSIIRVDNVQFIFYPRIESYHPPSPAKPTDGCAIDHYAISFRDIKPVYDRMKANGVKIDTEIAVDPIYKIKSFFVHDPDGVRVEICEDRPIPSGIWDPGVVLDPNRP